MHVCKARNAGRAVFNTTMKELGVRTWTKFEGTHRSQQLWLHDDPSAVDSAF